MLQEKPSKALIELQKLNTEFCKEDPTISNLKTRIDSTYAHAVNLVGDFEDEGLVESSRVGRKKLLKLTDEASEVADHLREIEDLLEEVGQ